MGTYVAPTDATVSPPVRGRGHVNVRVSREPVEGITGGDQLSRGHLCGLAGVLADGRLRDFDQLSGHRFATWCRGEATRRGGDIVMPYAADVAVEIGGVMVTPGDWVCADASGAVVIPAYSIDRVLAAAEDIAAEDTRFPDRIRGGRGEGLER
jgi:regulator of RNase E activity RraA